MNPESEGIRTPEKRENFFEVRNLGEADNKDIASFQESMVRTNGFLDLVVHPFFLKGEDEVKRRKNIHSTYTTLSPEIHKAREDSFNTHIKKVFDQSGVPERLKSTVLVMEEYPLISSVKNQIESLIGNGSEVSESNEESPDMFSFPTDIDWAIPHSQRITDFMFLEKVDKDSRKILTFLSFLWETGVRKIRMSGGYLTYENDELSEKMLNRCVGYVYRSIIAFNRLAKEQRNLTGFDVDISFATFPENPQTLKEKGAKI